MSAIGKQHFKPQPLRANLRISKEEENTMQDDIDWTNASADFGLIQLCREMEALARPVEALLPRRRQRVRRKSRIATPARVRLA